MAKALSKGSGRPIPKVEVNLEFSPEQGEGLLERIKEGILLKYQDLFQSLEPSEQANLAGAIHTLVRILERAVHSEEEGG